MGDNEGNEDLGEDFDVDEYGFSDNSENKTLERVLEYACNLMTRKGF